MRARSAKPAVDLSDECGLAIIDQMLLVGPETGTRVEPGLGLLE
jgi:hypothetical protein